MALYLEFSDLNYNSISDFIEDSVSEDGISSFYLLGKAAAYTDVAYSLDFLTFSEAKELHACIAVYAGLNTE